MLQVAATKQRLAIRTAAARSFSGAAARLAQTKAALEGAQTDAERAQAEAVSDLIGSGLQRDEVAELVGVSTRELGSLRATTPAPPTKASRRINALEPQRTHLAS